MNLGLTLGAALAATHLVHWLRHRRGAGPAISGIRAACLVSLVYSGLARMTGSTVLLSLETAVFGATFCAMSEPHRLSERLVLISGGVFGLLFFTLHHYGFETIRGGLGGTLGGCAFTACLIVYGIRRAVLRA